METPDQRASYDPIYREKYENGEIPTVRFPCECLSGKQGCDYEDIAVTSNYIDEENIDRIPATDDPDFYPDFITRFRDADRIKICPSCGVQTGETHHLGCQCEVCPVCDQIDPFGPDHPDHPEIHQPDLLDES